MFRTVRTGMFAVGALLSAAGVLWAGGTRSFRQTTAKEFEEGEATASVILPTGQVAPGMKATRVPLEAAFVWCAAVSPDGRTGYFGTGDQGRVYAVTLRQGTTAPVARKLADLDAPWVTSLAVRADGTLIAGTTPGGKVFAINPQNGQVRGLAKLGAEHVWTLVHDPKSGDTYAGAGGAGKIFRIDGDNTVRLHWDSGDKQVVSLLSTGNGTLLAGTSEQGIVYRVHANGSAEAMHDFDADEVRAILRAGGATYLAVNDFDKAASGTPAPSPAAAGTAKGTKISLGGSTAPASVGSLPRPSTAKARSAVYRLADDGGIEQVFALADGYLTALLADASGDVYAAAGTQGKVYRLHADRTFALAADLSERQALTLLRAGDGFLVGTGDVGGVYEVRPAGAGEASYLSKVFDGEFFSSWGRLRWTGSQNLSFETRSGNTAKPDKTWSAWKKIENVSFTGSEGEGRAASARARYLQYRVGFPGPGTSLKEVTLYYLPQNQRPRVTDVYLAESGGGGSSVGLGGGGASTAAAAPARTHSTLLKLRWRVENADSDELIYRIAYRQETESVWRPLGGPDPLTKAEYDWSTDSVPDGRYIVRVWVTDEKSTAGERALDSTFVSAPFLVDNTRPEVAELVAKPPVVTGRARDATSVVSHIEYSIDGQEWRPATVSDGLLDQRSEGFAVRLPPGLPKGPHVVNVRAWDATDNLGAARVQVDIR